MNYVVWETEFMIRTRLIVRAIKHNTVWASAELQNCGTET
jgi:hypothetical protein